MYILSPVLNPKVAQIWKSWSGFVGGGDVAPCLKRRGTAAHSRVSQGITSIAVDEGAISIAAVANACGFLLYQMVILVAGCNPAQTLHLTLDK